MTHETGQPILARYRALLAAEKIAPDTAQALAIEKLQLLSNRLASYTPPSSTDFFSFFTRKRGEVPKGLYIFGSVGRGKTMLMDLFFETVPLSRKRRVHFYEFMSGVHSRLAVARAEAVGDPILTVGTAIADETSLLCFDELFVNDIADASILGRLFSTLFDQGTVIVLTSNVPPSQLYRDGRNRELFTPFIDIVEQHMEVLQLEAACDYRLQHLSDSSLYFTTADGTAKAAMDALWQKLTSGTPGVPETLTVLGHEIEIPCASSGAARFSFEDLFDKPLGAADYAAIARRYHTIFVDGIPLLNRAMRDRARRLITFVDTLYDLHRGLAVSAMADPDALYPDGDGADHFQRTASRLMEMRTAEYLAKVSGMRLTGNRESSPEDRQASQ